MALRVENLGVGRGGLALLEGVSFDLAAGAALVLRGPNGIGKTTLLRVVAGLQPALSGLVEAGADTIAYAAHADGLKATLTAAENLTFWASVYGTKSIYGTEVVEAALAAMDLAALGDRMAMHLSAGQKRRLGLARLLVTGRPVWVLDEPTVSLDAASVQLFAGVVRKHLSTGGSALMATHIDLGLAEASVLDLTPYKSQTPIAGAFEEALG